VEVGHARRNPGGGDLSQLIPYLIAVRIAILLAGGMLTLFAFTRFYRDGSRDHLFLSVGFGLISLGALIEGLLFQFLDWSLLSVHTVEAAFTASGLLVVLLTIHLSRR
jgi:hypothetical protein